MWFEHTDAERDEPDERTRNLWRRGNRYEQLIVEEILDELATEGITGDRQVELDWPDTDRPVGQTHVDLIAPLDQDYRVVEVKSNAGAELTENAALQVSGQAMLLAGGGAEHGQVEAIVEAVDSHTGERRSHLINWQHYEVDVEELWALARGAVDATETPDRVADHPSDARCMWCPFKGACWSDWEPAPLEEILGLDDVAAELATVKADSALLHEKLKKLGERKKAAQDMLRPHLPIGELVRVGQFPVRLTVSEVETFALAEARRAGLELPSEFDAYLSRGPREYWTVKAE